MYPKKYWSLLGLRPRSLSNSCAAGRNFYSGRFLPSLYEEGIMIGNSLNLVDLIQGHLSNDFIGKMSSVLGDSSDRTRAGINATVPGLLSAFDRTASTTDGARRITSAVDDADESMLDNLLGMFGKGFSSETGTGILRSILGGGGLSNLADSIARVAGLSGRSTSTMLGFIAPIVFAVLKKVRRTAGFDIPSLLASQRTNIAAAMPEGMIEETYTGPRPAARTRPTETYTGTREPQSSWVSWVLPLALLAGALGLIWHWARPSREVGLVPSTTVHAGREEATPRTATLDQLIPKYRTVLDEARAQGIHITDMREQNGKLVLKG